MKDCFPSHLSFTRIFCFKHQPKSRCTSSYLINIERLEVNNIHTVVPFVNTKIKSKKTFFSEWAGSPPFHINNR